MLTIFEKFVGTVHMIKRIFSRTIAFLVALLATLGLPGCGKKLSTEEIDQLYRTSLPVEAHPLTVYHLGHSLVGKDMPYMLAQLAGEEHRYHSQLGWGATLQSHWEPNIPVSGFESENQHDQYRDPFEAIDSTEYNAFIVTEMVEIEAAIKSFKSSEYLAKFAKKIHTASPNTVMYLYETWHEVTDPKGWINRLDHDLNVFWEEQILYRALAELDGQIPIYVIPAGQVLSAFFKEVKRVGGVGNIQSPNDIFSQKDDGSLDPIHINDLGNYLVALVHYATIYRQSPEGLPYQLNKADGTAAFAPTPETAALMQKITWDIVSHYPKTGI